MSSVLVKGSVETTAQDTVVIFKKLAVLSTNDVYSGTAVAFPSLVHAEINSIIYAQGFIRFKTWEHLESLLLRQLPYNARSKWEWSPNPRLLGIPDTRVDSIPLLPSHRPLQDLWVYSGADPATLATENRPDKDMWWLHGTVRQLPCQRS